MDGRRNLVRGAIAGAAMLALPGPLTAAEPAPVPAELLIDSRCTFCHGRILTIVLAQRRSAAAGKEGLDAFLASHHAPDEEARAAILAYLSQFTTTTGGE